MLKPLNELTSKSVLKDLVQLLCEIAFQYVLKGQDGALVTYLPPTTEVP